MPDKPKKESQLTEKGFTAIMTKVVAIPKAEFDEKKKKKSKKG